MSEYLYPLTLTTILWISDDKLHIKVEVFSLGDQYFKAGDTITFKTRDGLCYPYTIDAVDTPNDPGDQHFLTCTFNPPAHDSNPRRTA